MTKHEMRLKIQDYDCTYGDNPFLIHCPLNKPCMKHKYENLHQKLLEETQTKGVECDKCGWAMKFPDEPCRCELEDKLKELKELHEQYVYFQSYVRDLLQSLDAEQKLKDGFKGMGHNILTETSGKKRGIIRKLKEMLGEE